jgi:hypothetical protein
METSVHRAPTGADRALAVRKLDEALHRGIATAEGVVRRVMDCQPHDAIVRAQAMRFAAPDGGAPLTMTVGENNAWSFHPHAFGQVANYVAPKGAELLSVWRTGEQWMRELLCTVLNTTFEHSDKRHLIRSVGGDGGGVRDARGFLSDKYRRIDSRPICEAFVHGCQENGAQPYGGSAMDTRHNLKFIHPEILEPTPGEYIARGLEWSSGDFGDVAHQLRMFLVRLWCLNGATAEDLLRQVHIGSRLDDEIEFSDRTMRYDTKATLSATVDMIRSAFLPANRDKLVARIAAASAERIEGRGAFSAVARNLTKAELESATEAFEGPDVLNLPEAPTRWRASNVLSLMAQQSSIAPERREELERLAGSMLKAA